VTAVVQDADTGRVLMVAWMDGHALARTLATRQATFYSRSRQETWVKGLTSGSTQQVVGVELDCDGDAVLVQVRPAGPACHTGLTSCFDTLRVA
jgi:phosphoribosyl-AMP cyclohydrolase